MQVASRTIVCAAVCVTLLFFSCTCDGVPKGFFLMPPKQQLTEFEKYDFDTQYKIYICGQQREPPMLELVSPFAREGGRIVPLVKAKLESTDNDSTVDEIVYVFREMNDMGTYDVAGDKSLMEELREKVTGMKDPALQKITEKNLLEIREKSPKTSKP
jgi:hypothetical protein